MLDEYPSMRLVMEKVAERRLSRVTGKTLSLSAANSREGIHVTFQPSRSLLNVGRFLTPDQGQEQVLLPEKMPQGECPALIVDPAV